MSQIGPARHQNVLRLCRTRAQNAAIHHEVLHMSSKNPRLSVVLTPSLAATLAALSEETGDSASSLVRGLLEQTEPALQRMLELVRAAKSAKGQIGAGVSDALGRLVDDLHDAAALADSRARRVVADLVTQAEVVKGRRRGPATDVGRGRASTAAFVSTPACNTVVRSRKTRGVEGVRAAKRASK